MKKLLAGIQLQALALAVCVAAPLSAWAGVPVNGTNSITAFCGNVTFASQGMTNHGVKEFQPYVGFLNLIQEPPENPNPGTTYWPCDENIYGCGTISVTLPGFVPPPTDPDPSDIFGPVESIHQSVVTYRILANVDGFVVDPQDPTVQAVGTVDVTILCSGCPDTNNPLSIKPDYKDQFADINGDMEIRMQVPGIGGSLSPPEGNPQEVNGTVTRIGGACNNILPATSSWGLVGLVSLMVATSIVFAGRRAIVRE
jgi:hypothetical protein